MPTADRRQSSALNESVPVPPPPASVREADRAERKTADAQSERFSPTPPPAAPAPAPPASPTPAPSPGCSESATPTGSVDWYGCRLPGEGDLKSWTNYILRPFPPACAPGDGAVTATGGAQRLATVYDHRFPVTSTVLVSDNSWLATTAAPTTI